MAVFHWARNLRKKDKTFETYGLKQVIDISVAINHLIQMRSLKLIYFYMSVTFFLKTLKREVRHINWDRGSTY